MLSLGHPPLCLFLELSWGLTEVVYVNWMAVKSNSVSLCFSSTFIGIYYFTVLPVASEKHLFCFNKEREPKICICNPSKNACLGRILIKCHLERLQSSGLSSYSHRKQKQFSLTTEFTDTIRASIYKVPPLLESERDSSRSFLHTPLLLTFVLHFNPDLVIDGGIQGRDGFKSIEWNQSCINCVI